jgi:septal ring factor EnvC (AmiA/AmiB activator)
MRRTLCALAVSLSLLSALQSWGQASYMPSTDYRPGASAAPSSSPAPTWEQLDEIWAQLELSGQTSSADSQELKTSLASARQLSTTLSAQLAASRTQARELSSSLERADNSLLACERSLILASAQARRRSLEAGLWRVGALSGVGACLGAIAWKGDAKAAGLGAIPGLVAGAVWWAVENWPPWKIGSKN